MHMRTTQLGLLFVVAACHAPGPERPASATPARGNTPDSVVVSDSTPVSELEASALPPALRDWGVVEKAMSWTDQLGTHIAVFSSLESRAGRARQLRVTHALQDGSGAVAIVRTVNDGITDCDEGDLTVQFVMPTIAVTDLDHDGHSELTCAYRMNCTTDVSPSDVKVIVLDKDTKYILRGQAALEAIGPDPARASTFTADPAEARWPVPLLAHAKTVWGMVPPG